MLCQSGVPSSRGLMKIVKRLVQLVHMIWKFWVDKMWRLINVDFLFYFFVQEGNFDIHLIYSEANVGGVCQEDTDCFQMSHGSIYLWVIKTFYFPETTNEQMCTITPLSSWLLRKTHLVSRDFFPLGSSTSFQTFSFSNWFNSSCMAFTQLGSLRVISTFFGSI